MTIRVYTLIFQVFVRKVKAMKWITSKSIHSCREELFAKALIHQEKIPVVNKRLYVSLSSDAITDFAGFIKLMGIL